MKLDNVYSIKYWVCDSARPDFCLKVDESNIISSGGSEDGRLLLREFTNTREILGIDSVNMFSFSHKLSRKEDRSSTRI